MLKENLTTEDIASLTDDNAMEILDLTRERLIEQLTAQRQHPHLLDDCGDYLMAATENWTRLFDAYFTNDGTNFLTHVKAWLNEDQDEWGGSDGEIRFFLIQTEDF